MMKHKHAELLRMAADNADQLFYCEINNGQHLSIENVLADPNFNWRPVKQTKKIKRWLWADKYGEVTGHFHSEDEITIFNETMTKLLWSETEFEVSDD